MNKEYKRRIRTAEDYIAGNIDQDLTLDAIAEKASFSKYHFHRIFKAVTGETVSAHIRRLRLEKAANRLLTDSGESITTIALDCGFGSSQNFATTFKQKFGCSPGKFREQYSSVAGVVERGNQQAPGSLALPGKTTLNPSLDGSNGDTGNNLWINLMDMPAYRVAYERVVGPYDLKNAEEAFKKLYTWAYKQCDIDASIALGIIWDNPEITDPQLCRYDACVTIPDIVSPKGKIDVQKIKGGRYVVGHCEVSSYTELEQAYENIFAHWFPASNYTPADAVAYEVYLNNPASHPRQNMLLDICIPIEKISGKAF